MMTSSNGNIFSVASHLWGEPPVTGSPHEGQWRGALMFNLICAWTHNWANHRYAGDLRRHRTHYDVTLHDFRSPCFPEWSRQCSSNSLPCSTLSASCSATTPTLSWNRNWNWPGRNPSPAEPSWKIISRNCGTIMLYWAGPGKTTSTHLLPRLGD